MSNPKTPTLNAAQQQADDDQHDGYLDQGESRLRTMHWFDFLQNLKSLR